MKKAFTLAEVIMAAIVLTILAVTMVSTLKNSGGIPNSDLVKFRYAYGTVLDIIDRMSNDQNCYPTENLFAKKPIEGCEFNTKFKSYLNIFEQVTDSTTNQGIEIPLYQIEDNTKEPQKNPSDCFIDNKGIAYCVPKLCNDDKTDTTCFRSLELFEIKIFMDGDIEQALTKNDRTLYINVSKTGKVSVPGITMNKEIDCGKPVFQKGYYQCSLSTMIESM